MAITKTIRFEVFKRDGFRCQYCGKTPPEVTLEVDHIQPRSKNGRDNINNLITACFECNRGKRDIVLERVPNTVAMNLEVLKEKEVQLKEYNRFIQKVEKRLQAEAEEINQVYNDNFPGWELSDKFKSISLRMFLEKLPKAEVAWAMKTACQYMARAGRGDAKDNAISYFCGICWKKIRGESNGKD